MTAQPAYFEPRRPADPARQRASDADRDRVAAILGEALATGRLTSIEHADRLEAAYSAVTLGDLLPLVEDLPDVEAAAPGTGTERQQVAAVFSKIVRRGRWVVGRRTRLRSLFGALIVDLTDAVLPGREITLDLDATFGKLIVRIPRNARVIDEGGALFSKRHVSDDGPWGYDAGGTANGPAADGVADPGAPLIRITGNARFGKIVVAKGEGFPYW
ncbi:hypothetical protein GCM10010106_28680 [Thermopolyspora flexuosa]|uniref:Uncharacterized protein DUF1707 n=1 Tax=Thermopolyspora flexuosa TaxID=103836 RepID=A0A543IP63_9ACTN|nr:DUF1707 domain-containing protein [Thermopolyspora flexuosa]TQM72375.1 uncharacterized protein DUF1707 [Thermopolyspora flexuosa]GGM80312.1 hypothetical protein GCM10010106_28680 [Thermopolyspora flexuosa]